MTQPVACFLLAKLALNAEVFSDDDWTDGQWPDGKQIFFEVDGHRLNAWETARLSSFGSKVGFDRKPL